MHNLSAISFVFLLTLSFAGTLSAQWAHTSLDSILVTCLAANGTDLFVGATQGRHDVGNRLGVWRSADSGFTWTRAGLVDTSVSSLAVKDNMIFAGTDYTWPNLPLGAGVMASSNNGTNWTSVNNGLTDSNVSALAVSGVNLFAGTRDSGVFLSSNNGANWTAVNSGLTGRSVHSLHVYGTNLFAGTDEGVCLSTNDGASWVSVNSGLTDSTVYGFASTGTNLFAATWGQVYHSTDLGASWNQRALWWDRTSLCSNGKNVYAGLCGGQDGGYGIKVLLSSDNGTTWTAVEEGLASQGVISLALAGEYLFAGGVTPTGLGYRGGRLWRRPLSEMITSVSQSSIELPATFELKQNYPNPFNPTTTIGYQLPTQSHVTLKVFDVLGREVATLVNGAEEPGYRSVTFDASKLSSGVYFYRVQAGNYNETKKLLLLR